MDLNFEYAAHQRHLMAADAATSDDERQTRLTAAAQLAARIGVFQHGLGAAAACAWSKAQVSRPTKARPGARPGP